MSNSKKRRHKKNRNSQEEFDVEDILDKKIINGQELYKVKWQGFPVTDCTWEPLVNLVNVEELILQFENKQSQVDTYIDFFRAENFIPNIEILELTPTDKIIGSLKTDVPDKILAARITKTGIMCKIQWKERKSGIKPKNSEVSSKDLKKEYKDMLIDFYESRVKQ